MSNHIVNQCEYGCGIVGNFILETQESNGEELEEHYAHCPNKKLFDKIYDLIPLYETAREEGSDKERKIVAWELFDLFKGIDKETAEEVEDSWKEKIRELLKDGNGEVRFKYIAENLLGEKENNNSPSHQSTDDMGEDVHIKKSSDVGSKPSLDANIQDKTAEDKTAEEHLWLIKNKFNGSVRDYLLSMGDFKDVQIEENHSQEEQEEYEKSSNSQSRSKHETAPQDTKDQDICEYGHINISHRQRKFERTGKYTGSCFVTGCTCKKFKKAEDDFDLRTNCGELKKEHEEEFFCKGCNTKVNFGDKACSKCGKEQLWAIFG